MLIRSFVKYPARLFFVHLGNLEATFVLLMLNPRFVSAFTSWRTRSDLTVFLPAAVQAPKPGPNPVCVEHQ